MRSRLAIVLWVALLSACGTATARSQPTPNASSPPGIVGSPASAVADATAVSPARAPEAVTSPTGGGTPAPPGPAAGAASTAPAWAALPLGDGNVSSSPQVGYVFSCQTTFGQNGAPGGKAPWIAGSTWDATAKPMVRGEVAWPNSRITITLQGAERIVRANNLPTHPTGMFPIQRTDPVFRFDANPNPIREQTILLRLPANPREAAAPSCVPQGMIGFTVSGAALYNALDGAGRDAAAHEVQDLCDGHPQGAGQYHYHSWSDCLADAAGAAGRHSDLIGYALDGFGVFGLIGEGGAILSNADLDACHGHTHPIMWDGQLTSMYHYHMTREYPYSVGCFHGTRGPR